MAHQQLQQCNNFCVAIYHKIVPLPVWSLHDEKCVTILRVPSETVIVYYIYICLHILLHECNIFGSSQCDSHCNLYAGLISNFNDTTTTVPTDLQGN